MKDGCPFCDYAGPSEILWRDEWDGAIAFEPLNPVTPGHVLVVPTDHEPDFASSAVTTSLAFFSAVRYVQAMKLKDVNLITSKGKAATQTVQHLHIHVLPRTEGDGLTLPWPNPHG